MNSHGPAHLLRSLTEGAICALRANVKKIECTLNPNFFALEREISYFSVLKCTK